jgi:hypothetical protein
MAAIQIEQWLMDVLEIRIAGLFASTPLLIIDDEWLAEIHDAPPPHVILTLAKRPEFLPDETLGGQAIDPAECPFSSHLSGRLQFSTIKRIEPSEERESLGGWIISRANLADPKIGK